MRTIEFLRVMILKSEARRLGGRSSNRWVDDVEEAIKAMEIRGGGARLLIGMEENY